MASQILIVEDDERIRASMRLALEDEGYEITEVGSSEDALVAFGVALATQPFDVVIIDIMLPGMDGFGCCREIRRHSGVPIIMVTARTDTHDVVATGNSRPGADGLRHQALRGRKVGWPRIRALLRRAKAADDGPAILTFGDLEVLPEAGTVRLNGEEVHLTRTEFMLLCELASKRRQGALEHRAPARRACGATTTSATEGSSTSTCAGSGSRSSRIRRTLVT